TAPEAARAKLGGVVENPGKQGVTLTFSAGRATLRDYRANPAALSHERPRLSPCRPLQECP
ncbi:hypothetical protein PPH41_37805, partial [Burkholderia gladioli]|nr:hypothetical protein [Burkholderia gladioli]